MGNVKSVLNGFELLGEKVCITDDYEQLSKAEAIILPGVGSFSDGMSNLRKKGLVEVLKKEVINNKKPYLGICLGLQFLAEKSFEGGEHEGFGWIKGEVTKITNSDLKLKVPHMGWNDTNVVKNEGLLKGIEDPVFYYLHSYYFKLNEIERNTITSVCEYGGTPITASIQNNNIYAVQFHPEKSQTTGIKLLKNFLDDIREKNAQT